MIAIIVAMDKELELLLPLLTDQTVETRDGRRYHRGRVGSAEVVVTRCGIGKVNAALATRALIDTYRPEAVINTGVAGGTGGNARVLDVVVATETAYHDTWCGPGTEWGQADGCPARFRPSPRLLSLPPLQEQTDGVTRGLICSGDTFVADAATLAAIRERFPEVEAVDMESAAVAHVCHLAGVDMLSLRVVSDTPGQADDNASQYTDFWTAAPRRTFSLVARLLAALGQS